MTREEMIAALESALDDLNFRGGEEDARESIHTVLAALRATPEGTPLVTLDALQADIVRRWEGAMTPALNTPTAGDVLMIMGHVNEAFTAARALTASPPNEPTREWFIKRCAWYQQELDRLTASPAPSPPDLVPDHARTHAREVVDMYSGREPSPEGLDKWTLAAMAMGLLERWLATPLSSSVAPEPPIRPLDSGQGGQAVQRVAVCQTKNADRRDGCSEPPALVALVLEWQAAQHNEQEADVYPAIVRADAAVEALLAWTPAAPS